MKIACIVGTRPNFIKAIPVYIKLKTHFETHLIHTGQHYDANMSQFILNDLKAEEPKYKSVSEEFKNQKLPDQYASIMRFLDQIFVKEQYDWVFVFGDVTSTLIAAQVAKYNKIKVAHVESGLRSFDHDMPEEINRIMTDAISDLCFVTEESGMVHLKKEGKSEEQTFFVGNTMIDTLFKFSDEIKNKKNILEIPYDYYILTLHRPSNVDKKEDLEKNLLELSIACDGYPILFPMHPRTKKNFETLNGNLQKKFKVIPPMGYITFLNHVNFSKAVLTDSGGIQEETSVLGVPCFTLRFNTERPVTISLGTNKLTSFDKLALELKKLKRDKVKIPHIPLWDGKASDRILEICIEKFKS